MNQKTTKISQKIGKVGIKIVMILAVVSQIVMPGMARAEMTNISQNRELTALTIDQAPTGHIIYPDQDFPTPDKLVNAVITAYSSTVDQCDDDPFVAAWGDRVFDGMIAANWLPRGTKIKIPSVFGDKIFTVADRMNARYGYGRIDVWMSGPRNEINKFGVKRAEIEIYYPDNDFAKTHNKQISLAIR